ncbi:MAG TPA: hypothetical protein VK911_15630 [Vicinamibacterales bacterium]|nr:hypothetical protein [Vicinamibacterales bacterium]
MRETLLGRMLALPLLAAVAAAACQRAPETAQEVIARAVAAHGGERAAAWETMAVRGRVEMQDGITYNAAFLLQAKGAGKVRVEQDMTADRGRIFNDLFLDEGTAWSRRNLVVGRGNPQQMRRWLRHARGISYYAAHATALALSPEATVEWKARSGESREYQVVETRPAYVVDATVDGETVQLSIDKERFHLLQEAWPEGRRVYHDFKSFGPLVFPTRVLEISRARQGETVLPYVYDSVTLDQPIEDWVFTEDKPAVAAGTAPTAPGTARR